MFSEMDDVSLWLRVAFSLICGALVGLERQWRGKPVGIRTSILICFGTTIFIYMGLQIDNGRDISRILGQVITGIGFIGAGVIMTREGLISGVTSASVVWTLAGLGAAIGLGHYGIALIACVVILSVLIGVDYLEDMFKNLRRGTHSK